MTSRVRQVLLDHSFREAFQLFPDILCNRDEIKFSVNTALISRYKIAR